MIKTWVLPTLFGASGGKQWHCRARPATPKPRGLKFYARVLGNGNGRKSRVPVCRGTDLDILLTEPRLPWLSWSWRSSCRDGVKQLPLVSESCLVSSRRSSPGPAGFLSSFGLPDVPGTVVERRVGAPASANAKDPKPCSPAVRSPKGALEHFAASSWRSLRSLGGGHRPRPLK